MSFLNFLASKNIITQEQVPFFKEQSQTNERTLDSVLIDAGLDKQALLENKGEYFGGSFEQKYETSQQQTFC